MLELLATGESMSPWLVTSSVMTVMFLGLRLFDVAIWFGVLEDVLLMKKLSSVKPETVD